MIDYATIAKERRLQLGLSQQAVADRALCSLDTVWGFEHHRRVVRIDIIEDIFRALGLEIIVREVQKDDD